MPAETTMLEATCAEWVAFAAILRQHISYRLTQRCIVQSPGTHECLGTLACCWTSVPGDSAVIVEPLPSGREVVPRGNRGCLSAMLRRAAGKVWWRIGSRSHNVFRRARRDCKFSTTCNLLPQPEVASFSSDELFTNGNLYTIYYIMVSRPFSEICLAAAVGAIFASGLRRAIVATS